MTYRALAVVVALNITASAAAFQFRFDDTLHVTYVGDHPAFSSIQNDVAALNRFRGRLEIGVKRGVEILSPSQMIGSGSNLRYAYEPIVAGMKPGVDAKRRIDVAFVTPFTYVCIRGNLGNEVRPIVKPILKGAKGFYESYLVWRVQDHNTLDEAIAELAYGRQKRIAFVDPRSTSGFRWPLAWLMREKNIDALAGDIRYAFSDEHEAALRNLVGDASVRAAAVSSESYHAFVAKHPEWKAYLNHEPIGDQIPTDPVIVRPGLSSDRDLGISANDVRKALVEMESEDHETAVSLGAVEAWSETNADQYAVVERNCRLRRGSSSIMVEIEEGEGEVAEASRQFRKLLAGELYDGWFEDGGSAGTSDLRLSGRLAHEASRWNLKWRLDGVAANAGVVTRSSIREVAERLAYELKGLLPAVAYISEYEGLGEGLLGRVALGRGLGVENRMPAWVTKVNVKSAESPIVAGPYEATTVAVDAETAYLTTNREGRPEWLKLDPQDEHYYRVEVKPVEHQTIPPPERIEVSAVSARLEAGDVIVTYEISIGAIAVGQSWELLVLPRGGSELVAEGNGSANGTAKSLVLTQMRPKARQQVIATIPFSSGIEVTLPGSALITRASASIWFVAMLFLLPLLGGLGGGLINLLDPLPRDATTDEQHENQPTRKRLSAVSLFLLGGLSGELLFLVASVFPGLLGFIELHIGSPLGGLAIGAIGGVAGANSIRKWLSRPNNGGIAPIRLLG